MTTTITDTDPKKINFGGNIATIYDFHTVYVRNDGKLQGRLVGNLIAVRAEDVPVGHAIFTLDERLIGCRA